MSKASISIEGYISNELTMREVTGHRVLDVSVPHTPSKFNEQTKVWEDNGPTTWYRATFWDEHADAVLQSVEKGSLVTLTGGQKIDLYQKKDGTWAANVTLVWPVIAAVVRKPKRGDSGPPQEQWATTPPATETSGDVWNQPTGFDAETPF